MRVTIKYSKKKRNEFIDVELSSRLSKFIEKQNILELINIVNKIVDKILKENNNRG